MKNIFIFLSLLILLLLSCDKKSKVEKKVAAIPLKLKLERFDQLFFESSPKDLKKLKQKYPYFFDNDIHDSVWINKINNELWQELYQEVQKKYSNFDSIQNELTDAFKHIKFYFPKVKTPKIITIISEMDYQNKVIYADSLVIIPLELYLGKNHKFYQYPNYLKQNFERNQILPDVVSSFSQNKVIPPTDQSLLSQMIFCGKILYLKDLLLPNYSDAQKMGYLNDQINWCKENEDYMWRYFLENELLYSTDQKLGNRFINPAPFSKFYLEIDNESPGSVGAWLGWQIVRAYAKNNESKLSDLLSMNERELFKKSKYKPTKNVE